MGTALLKIKIMPESPQTNLANIEEDAKKIIQKEKGRQARFEQEPIAFGLTAVIATFAIDESLPTDIFENSLKKIKHVNSAEIIDFRRAFG
ncbi:MAG: elongation factor 1-beta [Nanoarchaeota archaeon]